MDMDLHMQTDNLTREQDESLIDVLYRQDIDLGIGREAFDANLRKELEKERELELFKERRTETLDVFSEKNLLDITEEIRYIIDAETGEFIAVPANSLDQLVVPPITIAPQDDPNQEPQETISVEQAMELLEQEQETNQFSELDFNYFNMDMDNISSWDSLLPNDQQQQMQLSRQSSLEQRWQDVASLLNMSSATSNLTNPTSDPASLLNMTTGPTSLLNTTTGPTSLLNMTTGPTSLLNMTSGPTSLLNMTPSASSAIYSNVSLFQSQDANLGQEDFGLPALPDNCTMEAMEAADERISALLRLPVNQTLIPPPDTSLLELLNSNRLNEFNLLNLTDETELKLMDNSSSDSAFLSGSSPEYAQVSELKEDFDYDAPGSVSDYESSESTKFPMSKYSRERNFSSDSNDTATSSNSYAAAAMQHNHTYPLQPGQEAPPPKKRGPIKSGSLSRDERRAHELHLPFTVSEVISLSSEAFSRLLQRHTLNERQAQLVRDIRRRGKNKVAAQNCRKRKMEAIDVLEAEIDRLRNRRSGLSMEMSNLEAQRNSAADHLEGLRRQVFESLRDQNGQPYDPQSYNLQQAADGEFYLCPREHSEPTRRRPDKHQPRK